MIKKNIYFRLVNVDDGLGTWHSASGGHRKDAEFGNGGDRICPGGRAEAGFDINTPIKMGGS